jgi:branched-chain amino acid transport system permease protein
MAPPAARRFAPGGLVRFIPVVVLIVFALWFGSSQAQNRAWLPLGIEFFYIAAAALGVNILLGYTGLLSLGHFGFFVAGGYAGAIFTPYILGGILGVNAPWFGFIVAFAFGALLGTLLALMCCHLRGFYLTVVTLAFGTLIPAIITVASAQLGGAGGRSVDKFPDTTNFLLARGNALAGIYYVAVIFLFATIFIVWNLTRSRWGRAFMAIRESELAARSSGVNTYWYKVASFALSAGIVAVAGWIGALRYLSVSAGSAGNVSTQSFRYLVIIVLGGIGTIAGPVVGAIGITFGFGLRWVQEHFREYNGLLFGALGIIGVATAPEGLVGNMRKAVRDFQRKQVQKGRARVRSVVVPDLPAELTLPRSRSLGSDDTPMLEVTGLTKRFGGLSALSELDISVKRGTVHALIGPNGSGKSTFVNVITGIYEPTAGRITVNGEIVNDLSTHKRNALGIARTFQNLQVWRRMSILENVMVGAHSRSKGSLLRSISGLNWVEERRIRNKAWGMLQFVGLAEKGLAEASTLPFADQRRLEIARALASDPSLLLLDEPAAGLHPTEIHELVALIRRVRDAGITVLLIEHHMDLVMGLSDTVSVIDYGIKIAEGSPEEVRHDRRVIEAYLGTDEHV